MNPQLESLPLWASLPITLLLLLGSAIVLIGALGLVQTAALLPAHSRPRHYDHARHRLYSDCLHDLLLGATVYG